MTSPFLQVPESEWVASNALAFALRDRYPVSPGHTLVVPRRQVATWFEATPEEQRALFELVEAVKRQLDEQWKPDGYNVGFNVGEAAGQTVFHLHVHVIPRYRGDVTDPRGGVRHVIPGKGNYLVAAPCYHPHYTNGSSLASDRLFESPQAAGVTARSQSPRKAPVRRRHLAHGAARSASERPSRSLGGYILRYAASELTVRTSQAC